MALRRFRVKVIEHYCDYVWVEAESSEAACREAVQTSNCEFEKVYDAYVVSEEEIEE
jgi:hypothetical protein